MSIDIEKEREAAIVWAETHYRNVDEFTENDLEIVVASWLAARATPQASTPAAPEGQAEAPSNLQADLQAIDRAMQHMGDALNGMDAVEAEDEEAVSDGFEAMERLLAANDWVLVPVKPTPKMVDATFNDRIQNESHNARNRRIYAAMITATPLPRQAAVQGKWISVADRLPEKDMQVLVYTVQFGHLLLDEWTEHHEDPIGMGGPTICTGEGWGEHEFEDVSHWMPLPAAPQIEKDAK